MHCFSSGLGAGIAATAFIKHQINTTVVEIDPVVYKYARQYLGLLEPQEVYLEDARGWVRNQALSLQGGAHFREGMALQNQNRQYDYVIHDCFSGGSVPEHIFTREFWGDLKEIVKVDGVVAVVCLISLLYSFVHGRLRRHVGV